MDMAMDMAMQPCTGKEAGKKQKEVHDIETKTLVWTTIHPNVCHCLLHSRATAIKMETESFVCPDKH
jgi:hypothetical protein